MLKITGKELFLDIKKRDLLNKLSYETGLHIGDGHLSRYWDNSQNNYKCLFQYTGDLINEFYFYKDIIKPLIKKLYYLDLKLKIGSKNTSIIRTRNKNLFLFKKFIGLPVGKKEDIQIPKFRNKKNLEINFIKGVFDTDGSFCFRKKHKNIKYYPSVSLKQKNKNLGIYISKILNKLNINHTFYMDVKNRDRRYKNRIFKTTDIKMNDIKNTEKFLNKVDSNSSKHLTKYLLWKRLGYLPEDTTISIRMKMLRKFR